MTDVALLAELRTCGHAWLLRLAARVGRASLGSPRCLVKPSSRERLERAVAIVERAVGHWEEPTCKEAWWAMCRELPLDDRWWVCLLAPDEWHEGFEKGKLAWFWENAHRFVGVDAVRSIVGDVLAEAKEAR